MSSRYKITTYDTHAGIYGIVISFDGLLSHSLGPYPDRITARAAARDYVKEDLGGILWPRCRMGTIIQDLGANLPPYA